MRTDLSRENFVVRPRDRRGVRFRYGLVIRWSRQCRPIGRADHQVLQEPLGGREFLLWNPVDQIMKWLAAHRNSLPIAYPMAFARGNAAILGCDSRHVSALRTAVGNGGQCRTAFLALMAVAATGNLQLVDSKSASRYRIPLSPPLILLSPVSVGPHCQPISSSPSCWCRPSREDIQIQQAGSDYVTAIARPGQGKQAKRSLNSTATPLKTSKLWHGSPLHLAFRNAKLAP